MCIRDSADIAVLEQGARNAQDGVSMLQTMEGALQTVDNLIVRMQQLAEQAATGSYSSAQRVIMDNEFSEMASEITRIASSTDFNGIKMLNNSATVSVHFGGETDKIDIAGSKLDASSLGISTLSITTAGSARSALTQLDSAINAKDTARAKFGYMINRLESTGEVLGIQSENLSAAESRISDVDVATEMATLTRNQVLAQAGTSMLAQANSIPQMALTLLG